MPGSTRSQQQKLLDEVRDVLLKGQLGGFLPLGHSQSLAAFSRVRASRTASWSLRSSSFFGSASVQ